jgi:hypothetical protein
MHAKACHWPDAEWGYSACCHMLGPECPGAVLYLPTFKGVVLTDLPSFVDDL